MVREPETGPSGTKYWLNKAKQKNLNKQKQTNKQQPQKHKKPQQKHPLNSLLLPYHLNGKYPDLKALSVAS